MIQNLLIAIGIATANVVAPNINIKKENPTNLQDTTVTSSTWNWLSIGQDQAGHTYKWLSGKQEDTFGQYKVEAVLEINNNELIQGTEHKYVSAYYVIEPVNAHRPMNNIAFIHDLLISTTSSENILVSFYYDLNVRNRDDIYLDKENLLSETYVELMQTPPTTPAWTDTLSYGQWEDNHKQYETSFPQQYMQDGKMRVSVLFDLVANGQTPIEVTSDTLTIKYDIFITPTEVIDLGGLMWQILGMPFSFISQAFNLTIFPNTQYAINISQLLFTIIGSLLLIIVVKKVIK